MRRKLGVALVACTLVSTACGDDASEQCSDVASCPPPDAGACTTDDQCAGEICDTTSGTCVTCTPARPDACTATTPVCSTDNECTACTSHGQCAASNVCLPTGACGTEAQIAYVSATGTGAACTKTAPCPLLATAVGKNLPYIKVEATGAAKDTSPVVIDGKTVTILAEPGATLDRDGDGPVLEVRSANTNVSIYDLKITGASGTSGADGILVSPNGGAPTLSLTRVTVTVNQGLGISSSGGSLSVTRSTISQNAALGISATGGSLSTSQSTIAANAGGGIKLDNATFSIVGNVFFNNGSDSALAAALTITTSLNVANHLEFNSFVRNKAAMSIANAIACIAGIGFTARNNIVSDNGTLDNSMHISGSCAHAYSIVRPGQIPIGTGNSGDDPMFTNTLTGDLHISATSPARGMAAPNSDLTGAAAYDIDGDSRTNPADIGADEVP